MINNVTLIGRLTKDIDLKFTSNGVAVGSFTLAVNRNFANANGEKEADFINCVVWKKPAETIANYTSKGSMLAITGRLQTRSYDNQQGQRIYVTEVVVDNFQFLGDANRNNQSNNNSLKTQETNSGFGGIDFAAERNDLLDGLHSSFTESSVDYLR